MIKKRVKGKKIDDQMDSQQTKTKKKLMQQDRRSVTCVCAHVAAA